MDRTVVLKALADETRMRIITLLLRRSYCVRALSRALSISEPAVSQQLKILREAGLLAGEKQSYYVHYRVDRGVLHALAQEIEALARLEREDGAERDGRHCEGHAAGGAHRCTCRDRGEKR